MPFLSIERLELKGKTVFIRTDLNVPVQEGQITNETRLVAALPTIHHCLRSHARVIICSHFGRPKAGNFDPAFSLEPIATRLSELLETTVPLAQSIEEAHAIGEGQATLLENIRFEVGETDDDAKLSQRLAKNVDVYCLDAFATAHRAHASTHGMVKYVDEACAGLLLTKEVDSLSKTVSNPTKPLVAVIGGAKVSGKLEVLHNLAKLADSVIVGGGMANTFLLAAGHEIGNSLAEPDLIAEARQLLDLTGIPLPVDVMVTNQLDSEGESILRLVDEIKKDEIVADIGPETARRHASLLAGAETILWNGPMGVFEFTQFGEGTRVVGEAIAGSKGYSVAGGGDTVAAIEKYDLTDQIDYISTGGGAFLEFMEGKRLPGIAALEDHSN